MQLKDRVAIITGGGKGIGKVMALTFAREGAIPILAGRDGESLQQTVREIEARGGRADAVATDVQYEDQIKEMVRYTIDKYGRIDVLVNNAATGGPTANLVDLSVAEWHEVIAINLMAPALCAREALKHMIPAKKGSIINISSEGGRSGFAMRSPYAVTKRGVIALTETLAIEAGAYGIRVNCISPGRVSGQRVKNVARAKAEKLGLKYEEVLANMTSDCSLQRFVEPEEVAAAALFLASDASSAITGDTLVVSCGKHMLH